MQTQEGAAWGGGLRYQRDVAIGSDPQTPKPTRARRDAQIGLTAETLGGQPHRSQSWEGPQDGRGAVGPAILGTNQAEGLGTAPTEIQEHGRHGVNPCSLISLFSLSRKSTETLGNRPGLVAMTSG